MTKRLLEPGDLYRFRIADHVRLSPDAGFVAFVISWADEASCSNTSSVLVARVGDGTLVFESTAYAQARSPDWSARGELAFIGATPTGELELCVLDSKTARVDVVSTLDAGAMKPRWSPAGDRIAVLVDALVDADGVVRASNPTVAHSGPLARVVRRVDFRRDSVGYLDGHARQLAVVDRSDGTLSTLTPGGWRVSDFAWAPNGARLAFVGSDDPDSDLAETVALNVVDHAGRIVQIGSAPAIDLLSWSPRGDQIAYLAPADDAPGAFTRVWTMPCEGGERRCLTRDFDRNAFNTVLTDLWSTAAERILWGPAGDCLFFLASGPGSAAIYRVTLDGAVTCHVEAGSRSIHSFDVRDDTVAFCASTAVDPSSVLVANAHGERTLTSPNPWLADRAVAAPQPMRFHARDDVAIEGWLLRPPHLPDDAPCPLILEIHGGPFYQYGWAFSLEMQVLAAHGYQVLYTNPRASDGYGEAFRRHPYGLALSEAVYADLMCAVDQTIAERGLGDDTRLGVAGGSFGGYMTNFIIAHTTRFSAAAASRSVTDTLSELGTCDVTGPWMLRGDTPWEAAEALLARSPVTRADRIRTPLLLLHGELDFRATINHSEQLFGALRLLGRTVEFVRFPDESHELSRSGRPDRRVERLRRIADWFDDHLTGARDDVHLADSVISSGSSPPVRQGDPEGPAPPAPFAERSSRDRRSMS